MAADRGRRIKDHQEGAQELWGGAAARSIARPSLEYQHAFDLCAVEVHHTGGPVALLASSPFYARELLKRLAGYEAQLTPVSGWSRYGADTERLLGPEVGEPDICQLESMNTEATTIVWAEPEGDSGEQILGQIHLGLAPGGRLQVITSGWLARYLPEWRRGGDRPGEHPVGLRQTTKWLRQHGFTIEGLYGFHGPSSILWGYASRLIGGAGRNDLADRWHFKMRAEYVVTGRQAIWSPINMVKAKRQ